MNPVKWLTEKIIAWLTEEDEPAGTPPCDFERLSFEIRPCDVLLVEGRSRVSEVIKTITQSVWTHSAPSSPNSVSQNGVQARATM